MSNKSNIFYLRVAAGNYEYAADILADYMRTAGYMAALDLVENIKNHTAFSVRKNYEKTIDAGVFLKAQLQLNPPILQKIANNVLTRGYHLVRCIRRFSERTTDCSLQRWLIPYFPTSRNSDVWRTQRIIQRRTGYLDKELGDRAEASFYSR